MDEKPYDTIGNSVGTGRRLSSEGKDLVDPKFKSFRAAKQSVQENIKITEELPYVNIQNAQQEKARQFSSLIKERERNKLISNHALRKNIFKTNNALPKTAGQG